MAIYRMQRNLHFGIVFALFVALGTAAQGDNPEFSARLATWQQPRPQAKPRVGSQAVFTQHEALSADYAGELVASGCGNCACDGLCGGACEGHCGFHAIHRDPACRACLPCRRPMWWVRSDALLWWRKGRDLPVLVTSTIPPDQPPGEVVLYGDEMESGPPQFGGRIDFGTWLDWEECLGAGGRFWGLGKERTRFEADSDSLSDQTIERPFFDPLGAPDSLVVSDPSVGRLGSIDVVTRSEVFGADAYARLAWCRGCDFRLDLIGGYQFARINEELRIFSSIDDSQIGLLDTQDQWLARNEFHGGSIGLLCESVHGCWTTELLLKVGLGNMRQTAVLTGFENDLAGGLLVEEPTTVTRDKFVAAPELHFRVACQVNPCWQLHAGYSLLYWSNVARPEALIDPIVGDNVSLVFRDSSYWVQGISVGATCRF
jgi:hypothetical protein